MTQDRQQNVTKLFDQFVILRLRIGVWQARTQDDGKDKWQKEVTHLVNPDRLAALTSIGNEARQYVRKHGSQFGLAGGMYLFNKAQIDTTLEQLDTFRERFMDAYRVFRDDYRAARDEAMHHLGDKYDTYEHKYPKLAALDNMFYFTHFVMSVDCPSETEAVVNAFRDDIQRAVAEAAGAIQMEMIEILNKMVDILSDDKRRIRVDTFDNIVEWCRLFNQRDFFSTPEFASAVERVGKLAQTFDIELARDNSYYRTQVATKSMEIAQAAMQSIENAPMRHIDI